MEDDEIHAGPWHFDFGFPRRSKVSEGGTVSRTDIQGLSSAHAGGVLGVQLFFEDGFSSRCLPMERNMFN